MPEVAVIEVMASVDRSAPGSDTDPGWVATVAAPPPLNGVFAYGATFAEAREALAGVVWEAVKVGGALNVELGDVEAVRVFAISRKTFPIDALKAS